MSKFINLVIPCAGQSKRFYAEGLTKHKAFLHLENDRPIIEKIISSFSQEIFIPHLIFTAKQTEQYSGEIKKLKEKFSSLNIHSIEEHNLGPTYSVMQIDLPKNEPILVHYCDFLTSFIHDELINYLNKGMIVAPYFSGFHPASLGTTNFAYMIVDSIEEMINLREKKPFTNNRIDEPASTGIYAFPKFEIFSVLSQNLFKNQAKWDLKEAYTSLLLNEAVDIGLKVKCIKVKNFICLGTPRDYKEYLFWNSLYFSSRKKNKAFLNEMNHLITAAGKGSRFANSNYRIPKIFNKFENKSCIELALDSISNSKKYILILDEEFDLAKRILEKNTANLEIYKIKSTPNGQLLSLKELIENINIGKNSFFVSSADYKFKIDTNLFLKAIDNYDPDIIIFTTEWEDYAHANTSNYGFIESGSKEEVTEIIEKPTYEVKPSMLKKLLMGTFWFKNKFILDELELNPNQNGECFIASSIKGKLDALKVISLPVDYWLSLGTPQELDLAKYWFEYFES